MTSKERAYLKGLAMNIDPIFQIGKSSVTPENIEAIRNATVDDLKELPSMNEKSAQEVYKFFHQDT